MIAFVSAKLLYSLSTYFKFLYGRKLDLSLAFTLALGAQVTIAVFYVQLEKRPWYYDFYLQEQAALHVWARPAH